MRFEFEYFKKYLLPLSRWCDTPKIILKLLLPETAQRRRQKKYRKRQYIASRLSPCWSLTAAGGTIGKRVFLRFFWHPTFVHTTGVGRESAISPSSNWGEIGGVSGIGRYKSSPPTFGCVYTLPTVVLCGVHPFFIVNH